MSSSYMHTVRSQHNVLTFSQKRKVKVSGTKLLVWVRLQVLRCVRVVLGGCVFPGSQWLKAVGSAAAQVHPQRHHAEGHGQQRGERVRARLSGGAGGGRP